MKKFLVILAVLMAIAAPAMATVVTTDYNLHGDGLTNLLSGSSWGVSINDLGNGMLGIDDNWGHQMKYNFGKAGAAANLDGYFFKWVDLTAGTKFSISADWACDLVDSAGEFEAVVWTGSSLPSNNFNGLNPLRTSATTYAYAKTTGTQGVLDHYAGSFNTVNQSGWLTSGGKVLVGVRAWAYQPGSGEYKTGPWNVGLYNIKLNTYTPDPVPEPSSILALGTGLVGMAGFVIRRRK